MKEGDKDLESILRPENLSREPLTKESNPSREKESTLSREPLLEVLSAGPHSRFILSSTRLCSIPPIKWSEEFLDQVRSAAAADEQYQEGLKAITTVEGKKNNPLLTEESGLLYYKLHLYVPKDLRASVLASEHDSRVASHFGQDETIELVKRNFWWPTMKKHIIEYVQSCLPCQQDKA